MKILLLLLVLVANITLIYSDQVISAQVLFRHGARQQEYKNLYWRQFKKKLGLLTDVGVRQTYILGLAMRQRYLHDLKLLPSMDEKYIEIRSTNINRTISSAQSLMLGLFKQGTQTVSSNVSPSTLLPPFQQSDRFSVSIVDEFLWQRKLPLALYVPKKKPDLELRPYNIEICPNQKVYVKQNLHSDLHSQLEQYTKTLISELKLEAKEPLKNEHNLNFISVHELQDTFTAYLYQGLPLPKNLKPHTWKKMQQLSTLAYGIKFYQTKEQVKILSSEFFNLLFSNFDNVLNQQTDVKLHLYSAHDTTLLLVMQALGVTSTDCLLDQYLEKQTPDCQVLQFPPYASSLIFELVQDKHLNHYVQLLYNGLPLKICPEQTIKCPYQTFRSLFDESNVDLNSYCRMNLKKEQNIYQIFKEYKKGIIGFLLILVFVMAIVALLKNKLVKFVKQEQKKVY